MARTVDDHPPLNSAEAKDGAFATSIGWSTTHTALCCQPALLLYAWGFTTPGFFEAQATLWACVFGFFVFGGAAFGLTEALRLLTVEARVWFPRSAAARHADHLACVMLGNAASPKLRPFVATSWAIAMFLILYR